MISTGAYMARKVSPKKTPPARPDTGRDDLSVMHPDVTLPIGDRNITVREYGLVEGLRVRAQTRAFTAALEQSLATGEGLTDDVLDLVGEHYDEMRLAIAASTGVEITWIESLGDADADLLLLTWWGVCGPFFLRQILRRFRDRAQRKALLGGPTSTSILPTPTSAHPTSSAATPSDSSDSSTGA